jgi:hypothetical protein
MSNIAIWNGSSTFTTGSTPFGFYDTDSAFSSEADKVAKWCAQRLGYPLVNVELQSGSFYAAFEEAVTTYGNEVYQYKIRENYLSMEGNSTGSSFNNKVITPNLGSVIRLSQTYGTEAGAGGTVTYYSGSIDLENGKQDYDMNVWASASASLSPGDRIEIKKVFFEAPPAIVRYFDPYAGTGTGIQSLLETFGFGQMSPGINFLLMPIFFDVLKIQAIEFNDQIRKSAFSFDLVNNNIRLFPIPNDVSDLYRHKLFFHYIKVSERDSVLKSNDPGTLITNASNVPYNNPVYSQINSVGRNWVRQYTLALVKEILAYIRGKYGTIPIPGDEVTLNQADLFTDTRAEKMALLEQLRLMLEETSRKNQLEKQSLETGYMQSILNNAPLPIYII